MCNCSNLAVTCISPRISRSALSFVNNARADSPSVAPSLLFGSQTGCRVKQPQNPNLVRRPRRSMLFFWFACDFIITVYQRCIMSRGKGVDFVNPAKRNTLHSYNEVIHASYRPNDRLTDVCVLKRSEVAHAYVEE